MADVGSGGEGGGHGRHQKKRAKKLPTRIDMTPMVDLGFLLLTFFIMTTTFSKPKVIELTPPSKEKPDKPPELQDSLAMTVILSANDKVYYYMGVIDTSLIPDSNKMQLTSFADKGGIRDLVIKHNSFVRNKIKDLDNLHAAKQIADTAYIRLKGKVQGDKMALFVIIKTDSAAKYSDVVNMLDEMEITQCDKYALIDAKEIEILKMKQYNQLHNVK